MNMDLLLEKFIKIFNPENEEEFWNFLNIEAVPMCKGEISEEQFWKNVAKSLGREYDQAQMEKLWQEDFEELTNLDDEVIRIIQKLRKNYKVALISNIIKPHIDICEKIGVFNNFDLTMLSCELGLTKDSEKIFEDTLEKLDLQPDECIFIDDIGKFVKIANQVGMQGILYKNAGQLKEELMKIGIKI